MSRAFGPHRPIVESSSVRSTSVAPSTRWSVNHLRSAMPWAPPVTTRKWSSPRRITVRSERNPPFASSTGRVDHLADRDVALRDAGLLHRGERAGAGDVEDRERGQVDHAGVLAHREVLGVDDRAPPARVPLVLAGHHGVAVLLDAGRRWTRTTRAAPSRRSRRTPRRAAFWDSTIGDQRTPRSDSYCSRGVDDAVGLDERLAGARPDVRHGWSRGRGSARCRCGGCRSRSGRGSSTRRRRDRRPGPP